VRSYVDCSSDGDAVEAFLALESALAGTLEESRLQALSAAIGEFDFDGALSKLDEIAKECGVSWEQAK
jgi:two-component system, sensor histidine kinase and response regulator